MTRWACVCLDCGAHFLSPDPYTVLCPTCQTREDSGYATTMLVADTDGRPYAKRALQERLSIAGELDE